MGPAIPRLSGRMRCTRQRRPSRDRQMAKSDAAVQPKNEPAPSRSLLQTGPLPRSSAVAVAGIRSGLQQSRQMGGVLRHHLRGLRDHFRGLVQILEIRRAHSLAHPVAGGNSGNRPAHIVQRLENLRRSEMGAVLIADDRCNRDLGIAGHAPLRVGFGQEGVHSLKRALGDAARLAHPDRRAQDQNIRS